MQATARPYATAGFALVASSVIAVTPMAPPPDLHRVAAAVRLAASEVTDTIGSLASLDPLNNLGGLANIPYNVFADIVNDPTLRRFRLPIAVVATTWPMPSAVDTRRPWRRYAANPG
jgi:hypothetical protein